MAEKVGRSDASPHGTDIEWPRPVHDGTLIDADGTTWTMRGPALEGKRARRLVRTPDVRVIHAYGLDVVELGELRDEDRRIMLVAQESY